MIRAAVIGWPIAHSRSPLIHGFWLKRHGIDGSYDKIAVEPEGVAQFLASLEAQGLAGCNVTLPHKAAAYHAASVREPSAVAVGAANTLWLAEGRLHAANTDTYGFMRHLEVTAPGWRLRDRPVLILGAGGAARAIAFGFLEAGVGRVRVANRTRSRAEELARHFGSRVTAVDWSDAEVSSSDCSVLVNTTSLGMARASGVVEALDFDVGRLAADAVVADIVYVPLETDLLARARGRGLVCVDGLGMLLHQAVPGFARWFGTTPEVVPELRDMIAADVEGR